MLTVGERHGGAPVGRRGQRRRVEELVRVAGRGIGAADDEDADADDVLLSSITDMPLDRSGLDIGTGAMSLQTPLSAPVNAKNDD
jgi:hypothetical protein